MLLGTNFRKIYLPVFNEGDWKLETMISKKIALEHMEWVKTKVEQSIGYRNEKPIVSKLMINFDYAYVEEREWMYKIL